MADLIPHEGFVRKVPTPLTLCALSQHVGGDVELRVLPTGDVIVFNPSATLYNSTASLLAGCPVHGDAVLCCLEEIA